MPFPAHFAHIRQRDTSARPLTPITDVPTRKRQPIYTFGEQDERPADLGCSRRRVACCVSHVRIGAHGRGYSFPSCLRDSVSGQDAYSCFIDGEATVPLSTTSGTAWRAPLTIQPVYGSLHRISWCYHHY